MEGLKLRAFILGGVFLLAGGLIAMAEKPGSSKGKTEEWMEKTSIAKVASYVADSSPEDPLVSYRMPQSTYDGLVPFGIVARNFRYRDQSFDVVLIASNDRASFHDPRVCFSAQGYSIENEAQISIPTKTRGDIPATLAQMHGPNGPTVAVFFYRGPNGFYGTTMGLKWAMLFDQLKGKSHPEGVFYRFIPMGDLSTERLTKFIGMYMDESGKQSANYF